MAQLPYIFLNQTAHRLFIGIIAIHWVSEMLILRKVGPNPTEDQGSLRVLRRVLPLAWLAGILGTWIPQSTFGTRSVCYCGLAVMVAGQLLRWWSVATLGRLFTVNVSILEGHHVVESGPYRYVRHPSYAAILLIYLGAGLCLGNAVSLVGLVLLSALALMNRIRVEEGVLQAALGPPYRDYMNRTKRLLPGIY